MPLVYEYNKYGNTIHELGYLRHKDVCVHPSMFMQTRMQYTVLLRKIPKRYIYDPSNIINLPCFDQLI